MLLKSFLSPKDGAEYCRVLLNAGIRSTAKISIGTQASQWSHPFNWCDLQFRRSGTIECFVLASTSQPEDWFPEMIAIHLSRTLIDTRSMNYHELSSRGILPPPRVILINSLTSYPFNLVLDLDVLGMIILTGQAILWTPKRRIAAWQLRDMFRGLPVEHLHSGILLCSFPLQPQSSASSTILNFQLCLSCFAQDDHIFGNLHSCLH